jgi:hypothetical protein
MDHQGPVNHTEAASQPESQRGKGFRTHQRATQLAFEQSIGDLRAGAILALVGADRRTLSDILAATIASMELMDGSRNGAEEEVHRKFWRIDGANPARHQTPLSEILAALVSPISQGNIVAIDQADLLPNWTEQIVQIKRAFPDIAICLTSGTCRELQDDWLVQRVSSRLFVDYCQDMQAEPPLAMATNIGWEDAVQFYNRLFIDYINDAECAEPLRLIYDPSMTDHAVANPRDLAHLLVLLATETGQEQTIEDLAERTGFAKNTIRKYLDYLENRMLLRRQYRIGPFGQRLRKQKVFRAHIVHAGLRAALQGAVNNSGTAGDTVLTGTALMQWAHAPFAQDIHYRHSNETQLGADLVALGEPGTTPLLVGSISWHEVGTALDTLEDAMNELGISRGIYLSREQTDQKMVEAGRISQLPLSFYLYFIGLNLRRAEASGKSCDINDIFELG